MAFIAAKIFRRAAAVGCAPALEHKRDTRHRLIKRPQRSRISIQSRHHPTARIEDSFARVLPVVDAPNKQPRTSCLKAESVTRRNGFLLVEKTPSHRMWYDAVLQFGTAAPTRLAYRHIANGIGINRRTPARCRSSGHPHATRTSCFPRPRKRASNACGWVCGVICSRWNNSRNSRGKSHAAFFFRFADPGAEIVSGA